MLKHFQILDQPKVQFLIYVYASSMVIRYFNMIGHYNIKPYLNIQLSITLPIVCVLVKEKSFPPFRVSLLARTQT